MQVENKEVMLTKVTDICVFPVKVENLFVLFKELPAKYVPLFFLEV